jgi:hypothetical protein
MRVVFSRLLVFGTALSLAFPPGWCCLALQAQPEEPTEAPIELPHSCCSPGHAAPAPASPCPDPGEQDQAPAPCPGCCCQGVPAITAEHVHPPVDVALPAPLTGAAEARASVAAAPCARLDTPALSPPLQLLHCVWRC